MSPPFDPAAWVAEYEAIGGGVQVYRWAPKDERPDLCLLLTYPRDPAGRGNEMLIELNTPLGDDFRSFAVASYVATARGVRETSAAAT